jgi:hypothetical protein
MSRRRTLSVEITFRSVLQRLIRQLKKEGKKLGSPRGNRGGPRFVIDVKKKEAVAVGLDDAKLVALARKMGCVKPWEEVQS